MGFISKLYFSLPILGKLEQLKADQEDVRPDTDIVMAAEDVMAVHTRLDDATLDAAQVSLQLPN